ncbi:MAG: tail fiber domain-containing protein [Reyranella sp.]|nr:tail fiber domain-containing protein [Reyranella sp.]
MANFNGILGCPRFSASVALDIGQTNGVFQTALVNHSPGNVGSIALGIADGGGQSGVFVNNRFTAPFSSQDITFVTAQGGVSASTERMRIDRDGKVGVATPTPARTFDVNGPAGGTQAWISPSDARLKMDVRQIPEALELVKRLRGVRYRWRLAGDREAGKTLNLPTEETQIGFIAQEVAAVVPEAVVVPEKGMHDAVYGLKETHLLPILVEAIKEQQAQIESLRREVDALKASRLAALPVSASLGATAGR